MRPPELKQLPVNGVVLNYREEGRNAPVVMVHGATCDHRIWELQREAVAASYRYLAPDQRYFGATPWGDRGGRYSLATHAADLAAFLRGLAVGPVHLVGWSYGGGIALNLAVRQPELVKSLFLYEPTTIRTVVTDPAALQAIAEDYQGAAPALAAFQANDPAGAIRLLTEWTHNLPAGAFAAAIPAWVRQICQENARTLPLLFAAPPPPPLTCAQLGRLRCPVAVAKGRQTRLFLNILADTVHRCIPGAQLLVIERATHGGPYQNPAAFNAALLTFLARQ